MKLQRNAPAPLTLRQFPKGSGKIRVGRVHFIGGFFFRIQRLPKLPAAQQCVTLILQNTQQPGSKAFGIPQGSEACIRPCQSALYGILAVGGVLQKGLGRPKKSGLHGLHPLKKPVRPGYLLHDGSL